ncbi:hypothetical protein L7F22_050864 [Adiantum nelumboides]|nr:hypothetical protein [Adiantum nelumboides]
MTKTERKSEYNKLKKTLKDVWTTKMETDEDANSDKMDVPSHYKKHTIQDRKIIVQQPMRELKEPGASYDGPEKAKKIDLAEPGEEPIPAYIATDLTKEEEQLLIATLKQYKDVFAWSYKDLKGVDPSICQHTIPFKSDAKPSRQRPYTYNETFARKIKEEIDKLKEAEFIYEIEHTDWVSPIVVVLKKNGKLRVCVNLKKVNATTIGDNYPLSITDHVIEQVAGREAYSFLDGFSGYNQLAIKPEDQHKTAFATEWGIFAYRVMPFGITNAPATFQRFTSFCKMSKNDGISGLVSDKLDKNNFYAWKFRMTNFLMGKGYWGYIDGNQEEMPELPDVNPTAEQIKAFKDWNQGARKVMYWLSISVLDTMIGHIQEATSPKQAWDKLVSVDTTNTKARKIQLKNELNTVKKEYLSVNDYTLKIKGIVESLASIQVEDDDKVEVCLRGLTPAYKQFKTSIQTKKNIHCFADLVPMLVVEEKNLGEDSSSSQGRNSSEQVFYSNRGRGRGCGVGQGRGRGRGNQIKANSSINQMIHNGQTIVDVEIIEAGGVKEIAEITKEIMQIMKIENVGVVEEEVTLNVTVHQETRVAKNSKQLCIY